MLVPQRCHPSLSLSSQLSSTIKTILAAVLLIPLAQALAQEEVMEIDFKSGKSMYNAWCARCHGEDGRGLVEDLELEVPPPDFTDCSFNSREPVRDWRAVITHGGPSRGLSWSMPAWGEAISQEQIDLIISYIKTFCQDTRWPRGELNFRRPQITAKAFPENEALLIPVYTHKRQRGFTTKLVYEERIGPRGQWEIAVPFVAHYQTSTGGIGDIEVSGKYALYDNVASLSIVSAGLEVGLPTGNAAKEFGGGHWKIAPYLAAAKGFERLVLQSSVKYEQPLKGDERELQYNFAFTFPLTDEKKGLMPMLEFNGVKSLNTGSNSLFLTPQLYIGLVKRGHIALSFGTQIPIAGCKPFEYRIMTFLLWEYLDGGLWW
jgi:mono/diheme cytochrome c family protein